MSELEDLYPQLELDDQAAENDDIESLPVIDTPEELARVQSIYQEIIARVPEHTPQPSLVRVQRVMALMGDPQDSYPAIHITGTNGKTSTSRMIDSLLRSAGLSVGRFTSPHLSDVRERISINGAPISAAAFCQAYDDVQPFVELVDQEAQAQGGSRLSFFEYFTVMAFAAFAAAPVDVAVIEVGMGGTWDATNIIRDSLAVFTPIAVDHERWLGSTISEIATTKAGIIKPGARVVASVQEPAAEEILRDFAKSQDALIRFENQDFEVLRRQAAVGGQVLDIQTPAGRYEQIVVPLFGAHQAQNAATALAAVELFLGGKALSAEVVEQGFYQADSPGRLEVVKSSPTVLVDSAHNPAGATALQTALAENFQFERTFAVFGAMADKAVEDVLGIMEPELEAIVVTSLNNPRAMPLSDLQEIAEDIFGPDRVYAEPVLAEAVDKAVALSQTDGSSLDANGVVVFGSVALAGAVRQLFGLK
ncbi:hypothetical protein BSR29_06210 [Boudabousia liubingyangii]|uniref:Dihydrofolate synthase/folylpolyglutamate synthase n=1 Tax=Boudabousia liubingyangii TaxID=1921764 RepID=A0A1Q5PKQ5_9ACTO|nr:folylpolyglutamate synthase/dihydrofolate synthase family protein [Boudabousia liubingyangii]OKL47210.1 hypothetical protein BSR29_06210 [Boudabousia liubingyangii]